MLLLTFCALFRDDSTEADVVSHRLLGMPTIVTVSPPSLAAELRGAA